MLPSTNKVFIYLLTYSPLKSDPTIFQELRQLFQDAFVIASVVSGVPFHRPRQQSWKPIIVVNIFLMIHKSCMKFNMVGIIATGSRQITGCRSNKVGTTLYSLNIAGYNEVSSVLNSQLQ